eukprot:375870-Amphidinium_carterae.1
MACYFLVHPETSADVSPDVLPHPAMLGNYILAADASLNERWGCRICSTKTHPLRFASAVDLTMHMNSDHLTIRQGDELNDLLAMNIFPSAPYPLEVRISCRSSSPFTPQGLTTLKLVFTRGATIDLEGGAMKRVRLKRPQAPAHTRIIVTYAYRIGVDDRPNSSPPPAMRRTQPPKAITAPPKGAGKMVQQHRLKGKSAQRSPHPTAGKGQIEFEEPGSDSEPAAECVSECGHWWCNFGVPHTPHVHTAASHLQC